MQKFKVTAVLLSAAMLAGLSACSAKIGGADKDFSVVCTVFPAYDWVRELLGSRADEVSLTYLLDSGADLHNYQPTAQDMALIAECDLFIYVGGESDEWVDDALSEAVNKDMRVINLLETVGDRAKTEETVEGMESDEEEEEGEEPEYDEHVWLSVQNARICCDEITKQLSLIDKDHAKDYVYQNDEYVYHLAVLDEMFQMRADNDGLKTLIFGDRFPFRYFADDYGYKYYAAFSGCSAETEARFETVAFLAQKMDELQCDTIYVLEDSDKKIAETVIANTQAKNQKIAVLNSMQAVTKEQLDSGVTYLSLMEKNLEVLRGLSQG